MSSDAPEQLVIVSVGTDHHRFDRLMDWVEGWTASAPPTVHVVVQHGPSRCPVCAQGHDFLPRAGLLDLMRDATAVVVQGGPGGIMDSLACGRKPIVVPRIASLKEVVDDHQIPFTRHLASLDRIFLAESEATLHRELSRALLNPADFRAVATTEHIERTVERFDELVSQLVSSTRRPRWAPLLHL